MAALLPEVELIALDDVAPGLELPEPFETFEANAVAKARAVAEATGMPAIADDSGLEVDALQGRPGVRSARYAGPGASDVDNNRKLVAELSRVPQSELTCRYRCVAAYVSPQGEAIVAEGVCEGRLVLEGRGDGGFGYDPHVVPQGRTATMAETPFDERLSFSHRGRAFRALAHKLRPRMRTHDGSDLNETIAHLGRGHGDVGMDAADLDADPLVQFGTWMHDALDAGLILPNSMTLATATRHGSPSARIVLLKGVEEGGFVFYTNYESRKGRELAENPRAALVWHWAELERQVRATGTVAAVARGRAERYWASRPLGSRLGAWASRQSEVIATRRDLDERLAALSREYGQGEVPLPPYWGGYRLEPNEVEFWQGRRNRLHDRIRYRRAGEGWVKQRLAP